MAIKPEYLEKVPPHNLEAETSLLGAMMESHDAIADALEIAEVEDFYRPAHQKIFKAMVDLYSRGETVDPITTGEELQKKGVLEEVGGYPYLHTLISGLGLASNTRNYASIIERYAILRGLIRAAHEIAALGYEIPDEIESAIDRAEQLIFEVTQKKARPKFTHIKDLLTETFETVERAYEKKTFLTGLSTGYKDFDKITAGLQPSDLIIIASRPAMGKTSFALGIAAHVAVEENLPVALFSLEESKFQVTQRLLCREARVNAQSFRSGNLADDDWPRLAEAMDRLSRAPLYIDDSGTLNVFEIKSKTRRLQSQEKALGLIVVDYLQLMETGHRRESRQQEITEISRGLKVMARDFNVPVIAVSQLSRAVEGRTDKRPLLADLRESGAIEQDSDLVVFIYREEYYDKETEAKGEAEIIIGKHRHGPISTIKLSFIDSYMRFADMAK